VKAKQGKQFFFEKKRTKKLLLCWALGVESDNAQGPA
jgi:hypothetical protein